MLKRELYLHRLRPSYHSELIKVITGMRRSGKSVLLRQISEELHLAGIPRSHILLYNFEDLALNKYLTAPLTFYDDIKQKMHDDGKYYLFFDEIQTLPEFEKVVNSLRATSDVSIFLTGSNSQLLAGELATLLAGRYLSLTMMPFTFHEFVQARQAKPEEIKALFAEYLEWGGLPYVAQVSNLEERASYIVDLYNSIVLKDVIDRSGMKNTVLLDRIIQYLLVNLGHKVSANSISRFLKSELADTSSVDTVLHYIKALDSAMFTTKINRFDVRGKTVMKTLEKHYLGDLSFMRLSKDRRESHLPGRLENIVCNELLARGYQVFTGKTSNSEIDFVAYDARSNATYYQVAATLSDERTEKREFGAFDSVDDNYPKIVLSTDDFDFSHAGIRHLNIIDWLLDQSLSTQSR